MEEYNNCLNDNYYISGYKFQGMKSVMAKTAAAAVKDDHHHFVLEHSPVMYYVEGRIIKMRKYNRLSSAKRPLLMPSFSLTSSMV